MKKNFQQGVKKSSQPCTVCCACVVPDSFSVAGISGLCRGADRAKCIVYDIYGRGTANG